MVKRGGEGTKTNGSGHTQKKKKGKSKLQGRQVLLRKQARAMVGGTGTEVVKVLVFIFLV